MFQEPVVFVDIETSGASYKSARVIEIAAIRVENGEITDTYRSLVNPGSRLPYFITNLTGISDGDLVDAPYFSEISHEIERICSGAIFVAHNVRFDYSFIKNEMEAAGRPFAPDLVCTVRLSRALYPEAKGHSLAKLLERHAIPVAARHRAYDDAAALWEFCQIAHNERGAEAFADAVARQLKRKTLPPNLVESDIAALKNEPGVYIFEDESGAPIYVGKSVKIRSRVLSHFSSDIKVQKEMKMAQQTYRVKSIPTGDELQALLLESAMVKKMLPLYNVQLRYARKMTALRGDYDERGYLHIGLGDVDIETLDEVAGIWGLYDSRMKAKSTLQKHRDEFSLCSKLLGLEKTKAGCFHYHLKKCYGACVGEETPATYNARAETALGRSRLEAWPYVGAVTIRLKDKPESGVIVDQWRVVGVYDFIKNVRDSTASQEYFDLDAYKIIRSYMRLKADRLVIAPFSQSLMAPQ